MAIPASADVNQGLSSASQDSCTGCTRLVVDMHGYDMLIITTLKNTWLRTLAYRSSPVFSAQLLWSSSCS